MLFLLSPAKTLDFETPVPAAVARRATEALQLDRAAELIEVLKRKSVSQVARLMGLSQPLAALNVARYAAWQLAPEAGRAKPALLAFDGDVYEGLQARTLKTADLVWAQDHLVILSGLYGALRPLDRLQPYRLEMGTALQTGRGRDLYAFWADTVVQHLNTLQAEESQPVVVNLASQEYARVVLGPQAGGALRARVVECVFEEGQAGGGYKVVSFFAKKARGLMARHAVQQRLRSVQALKRFDGGGYAHDAAASTPQRLVFRRAGKAAAQQNAAP